MATTTDIANGNFAHMNVFFIITTVAVVIVVVLLAIVSYKVVKILNDVEHVSHNFSEESDNVRADVAHLRAQARTQGFKLAALVTMVKHSVTRLFKPVGKKRRKKE